MGPGDSCVSTKFGINSLDVSEKGILRMDQDETYNGRRRHSAHSADTVKRAKRPPGHVWLK